MDGPVGQLLLQSGRIGFLSQERLYEEFLRLPYVGMALGPE
ncbi:MAG: hypothetical protein ABIJ48_05470 [Actinomycetota bacterium]